MGVPIIRRKNVHGSSDARLAADDVVHYCLNSRVVVLQGNSASPEARRCRVDQELDAAIGNVAANTIYIGFAGADTTESGEADEGHDTDCADEKGCHHEDDSSVLSGASSYFA